MKRKLFSFLCLWGCVLVSAAEISNPWEAWRQAQSATEKGSQAREKGNYATSRAYYQEAIDLYRKVQKLRPDWNQNVIQSRIARCEQEITSLHQADRSAVSAPAIAPATTVNVTQETVSANAGAIAGVRTELEQYKKRLFAALAENEDLRRQTERARSAIAETENLMRENRRMQEEVKLLNLRLEEAQQSLASPNTALEEAKQRQVEMRINQETAERKLKVANDKIDELNSENAALIRERNNLETQLKKAKDFELRSKTEVANLQVLQDNAVREKTLWSEKETALGKQIAKLEDAVREKDTEIAALGKRLQQSVKNNGAPAELTAELAEENLRLRDDAGKWQAERKRLEEEQAALQAKMRENSLEMTDLRNALQRMDDREKHAAKESLHWQEQFQKQLAANQLSADELTQLRREKAQLEDRVAMMSDQERRFQQRLADRDAAGRSMVDVLKEDKARMRRELDSAIRRAAKLTADLELSAMHLQEERQKYTSMREEFLKLKAAALSGESEARRLPQVEAERKRLAAEVADLQKTLTISRAETAELRKLTPEVEKLRREVQGVRKESAEIAAWKKKISDLEKQNRKLRDELIASKQSPVVPGSAAAKQAEDPAAVSAAERDQLLAKGIAAEKDGADDLAIWCYRKILLGFPGDAEANRRHGLILLKRGDYPEAAVMLEKARRAAPDRMEIAVATARALQGDEKFGDALAVLEKFSPQGVNDMEFQLLTGTLFRRMSQFDAAKERLERALALAPQDPRPMVELAQLPAADEKARKTAAKYYEKAKKLGAVPVPELERSLGTMINEKTEMIDFLLVAAQEAEKNNDTTSAAWYYTQLREADAQSAEYAVKAAQYLAIQLKYEDAIRMLQDRPVTPQSTLMQALLAYRKGDFTQAETLAQKAVQSAKGEKLTLPEELILDFAKPADAGKKAAKAILSAVGR